MTSKTLVRVRVSVGVRAWINIYIRYAENMELLSAYEIASTYHTSISKTETTDSPVAIFPKLPTHLAKRLLGIIILTFLL